MYTCNLNLFIKFSHHWAKTFLQVLKGVITYCKAFLYDIIKSIYLAKNQSLSIVDATDFHDDFQLYMFYNNIVQR